MREGADANQRGALAVWAAQVPGRRGVHFGPHDDDDGQERFHDQAPTFGRRVHPAEVAHAVQAGRQYGATNAASVRLLPGTTIFEGEVAAQSGPGLDKGVMVQCSWTEGNKHANKQMITEENIRSLKQAIDAFSFDCQQQYLAEDEKEFAEVIMRITQRLLRAAERRDRDAVRQEALAFSWQISDTYCKIIPSLNSVSLCIAGMERG